MAPHIFLFIFIPALRGGRSDAADVAAIRAAYRLTNECYMRKDLKTLATTVLPSFYDLGANRHRVSRDAIYKALAKLFARQEECFRDEHADSVSIQGKKATIRVSCIEEYIESRPATGRTLYVGEFTGTSYWIKTTAGWKQEHLADGTGSWRRFKVSPHWHMPPGGWRAAPTSR